MVWTRIPCRTYPCPPHTAGAGLTHVCIQISPPGDNRLDVVDAPRHAGKAPPTGRRPLGPGPCLVIAGPEPPSGRLRRPRPGAPFGRLRRFCLGPRRQATDLPIPDPTLYRPLGYDLIVLNNVKGCIVFPNQHWSLVIFAIQFVFLCIDFLISLAFVKDFVIRILIICGTNFKILLSF